MYLTLSKKIEIELNTLEFELKEIIDIENPIKDLLSAIVNKIGIDKDKKHRKNL